MKISLAFSPCPNDTYIFDALVNGKIDTEGVEFSYCTSDVETLNEWALEGTCDMIKVSYNAWLYLRKVYTLLGSGSALGFGNGPLLISKHRLELKDIPYLSVAVPGEYTTANLLLKIAVPGIRKKRIMVFNEIEDAILQDVVDAGVIIHENRFTYEKKGLVKILDLGKYWEDLTGAPVPLGAIVARKSLGEEMIATLNRIMKQSVIHALQNPESPMAFVRKHAQEMDEEVMKKHIDLYVNEFTVELGEAGRKAVQRLVEIAEKV